MFNINKNYSEIALRQSKVICLAPHAVRAELFLSTVKKICPRCGAILALRSKGCDNCLFQFDKGVQKNVERY